jgi:hypothetical protein
MIVKIYIFRVGSLVFLLVVLGGPLGPIPPRGGGGAAAASKH